MSQCSCAMHAESFMTMALKLLNHCSHLQPRRAELEHELQRLRQADEQSVCDMVVVEDTPPRAPASQAATAEKRAKCNSSVSVAASGV